MNKYRKLIENFKGRGPLINIVLDGYGIGKGDFTDGIFLSDRPYLKDFFQIRPSTTLLTHGPWVGLPGLYDLGGSEVGHLTIGAGQIFQQGASIIKNQLDDGSFFRQPVLVDLYKNAQNSALHLIGLLSDGNIHSHITHFEAVIDGAHKAGVKKCYIHALLDGRDTPIQSALIYVDRLEQKLSKINSNPGFDYRIVSGGGREAITMDRAKRWDLVELGWKTHVLAQSGNNFPTVTQAIEHFRSKEPDIVDQDLPPFNITDKNGQLTTIQDGDSVIFMNFRSDRAIEITRAFVDPDFKEFNRVFLSKIYYAGLMVYDEDTHTPAHVVVTGAKVANPFGKRILELGYNQFRLAETQKFPHVTFFFNGGYRLPLDPKKEDCIEIPSDRVKSFAEKPKMKAAEVADKAIELINSKKYQYGLINFANPDMVGHTGNIEAVKIAVNAVDSALKKVLEALDKVNGLAIVTADHGNADEMLIFNDKTNKYEPSTKHSLNPVALAIYDPLFKKGEYSLKPDDPTKHNTLANILACNYILLGLEIPNDLDDSLFNV